MYKFLKKHEDKLNYLVYGVWIVVVLSLILRFIGGPL